MSNISSYVCQIIEKIASNLKGPNKNEIFSQTFFTFGVITAIIENVICNEENVSVYNAPILLMYLTNVPFAHPDDENVVSNFKELLGGFVDKVYKSCRKEEEEANQELED